ncbi:MAG: hypothetical protein HQL58_10315 [Magnetococcales bacterium]|nr:hypothetical protein [Magnetococcales bacterium]
MYRQCDEDRKALTDKITEARRREQQQRATLRQQQRQRLQATLRDIQAECNAINDEINRLIDRLTAFELQDSNRLEREMGPMIRARLTPAIERNIEHYLQSLHADQEQMRHYSNQLLRELSLELPAHPTPLIGLVPEGILTMATIGSIMVSGPVTIPALLLGLATLPVERNSLLTLMVDKTAGMAGGDRKNGLKTAISRALQHYQQQIQTYLVNHHQQMAEQAIQEVNYVDQLNQAWVRLQDHASPTDQEHLVHRAEALLMAGMR